MRRPLRPPRFSEPNSRKSSTAPPPTAAAGATKAAGIIGCTGVTGGGAAADGTGSIGATGETGSGSGAIDVTSRGGASIARVGLIKGGSADGGFNTIGGVILGRGRGCGVTTTVRGGTVVVGGRVEGGVALTSGTRILGGCVEGVDGRRFRIALKIAFSGILTPTDVDEDEPLFGVLSGCVLLGGVVAAPIAERFGLLAGGAATVGAAARGVTWMVLGVADVACAWFGPMRRRPRNQGPNASALTSTGFAGTPHFLFPPRKSLWGSFRIKAATMQ